MIVCPQCGQQSFDEVTECPVCGPLAQAKARQALGLPTLRWMAAENWWKLTLDQKSTAVEVEFSRAIARYVDRFVVHPTKAIVNSGMLRVMLDLPHTGGMMPGDEAPMTIMYMGLEIGVCDLLRGGEIAMWGPGGE